MSKFTAAQLVAFYQKVADGGVIEWLAGTAKWVYTDAGPCPRSTKGQWRIKPAKKIIDMAHFIKSGIDCEFSDSGVFEQIGSLIGIKEAWAQKYCRSSAVGWSHCRPRMNHKMFHGGGACPLPEGFRVKVYYRDYPCGESEDTGPVEMFTFKHNQLGCEYDIIGYEIIGLADGWAYPWECEE